jgi:hypothetical protein
MRISIPNVIIPHASTVQPVISTSKATERLLEFLSPSTGIAVLTGAGVSIDSGIRAYRGEHGRYLNPNYKSV